MAGRVKAHAKHRQFGKMVKSKLGSPEAPAKQLQMRLPMPMPKQKSKGQPRHG